MEEIKNEEGIVSKDAKTNVVLGTIESIIKLCNKYGILKVIFAVIMLLFIAYASYLATKPEVIFEKYTEFIEKRHNQSISYRIESTPHINAYLCSLRTDLNADRAYIIEMHNGKNNPSGLSFIYGSLNYEATSDTVFSIMEDYGEFSLERFPVFGKIYNEGYYEGSTDDVFNIDERFAYRLASNGTKYIAMGMIYGVVGEIGYIGVSFENIDNVNKETLRQKLLQYAVKISPFLDDKKRIENEKHN